MSEHKYTKGPWAIMNSAASCLIYGPLGERICKMLYPERRKIRQANANLIAAAPELLEALEDYVNSYSGHPKKCGHDSFCSCPSKNAESAIKKALGE